MFITLLLVALVSAQSEPELVRVQHRVVHPNLPVEPWSLLGTVSLPLDSISPLGSPATLIPSDTVLDDIAQFTELVDPTTEGVMYQVAIERPGVTDGVWPTSVVKAVSRAHIHTSAGSHPPTSVTYPDRPLHI